MPETVNAIGDRSVAIGGDLTNSIIQIITTGLDSLPIDYSHRLRNFIRYYLGSEDSRVPFGGRERELRVLDSWLLNEKSEPYALIAAPAGRGKSALLVQWIDQIKKREDTYICFIPISIRFQTALSSVFFSILATKLAEVFNEKIVSSRDWQAVCENYLRRKLPRGKKILIVLDGLDEAIDWQIYETFFPSDPPMGIHVLVSARFLVGDVNDTGWLKRLNWTQPRLATSITLPKLNRIGVGRVLKSMGNPLDELSSDIDIVSELYRLSEGDPLLIRLYVDELKTKEVGVLSIAPEELKNISPGFDGYINRWWEDQRQQWEQKSKDPDEIENRVKSLLYTIASALGPLNLDDLAMVVPPNSGLDDFLFLEQVLRFVKRFVIGDGKRQGFSFSHPRISNFFEEKLNTRKDKKEWETRYLNYGKLTITKLLNKDIRPEEVPSYILEYYGAHLEKAEAFADDFYELICKEWIDAWYAKEGDYTGFLKDLYRAWDRAGETNSRILQIKYCLCLSSIRTLSSNVPSELISLALKLGIITPYQALTQARQTLDDRKKIVNVVKIANLIPPELLDDIVITIQACNDDVQKYIAFIAILPYLESSQKKEIINQVRKFASRHLNDYPQIWALLFPFIHGSTNLSIEDLVEILQEFEDETLLLESFQSLNPYLKDFSIELTFDFLRSLYNKELRFGLVKVLSSNPNIPPDNLLIFLEGFEKNTIRVAEGLTLFLPFLRRKGGHIRFGNKEFNRTEIVALGQKVIRGNIEHYLSTAIDIAVNIWIDLDHQIREELIQHFISKLNQVKSFEERSKLLFHLSPILPNEKQKDVVNILLNRFFEINDSQVLLDISTQFAPFIENPLSFLNIDRFDDSQIFTLLEQILKNQVLQISEFSKILSLLDAVEYKALSVIEFINFMPDDPIIIGFIKETLSDDLILEILIQTLNLQENSQAWGRKLNTFLSKLPEETIDRVLSLCINSFPQEERVKIIPFIIPNLASHKLTDLVNSLINEYANYESNDIQILIVLALHMDMGQSTSRSVIDFIFDQVQESPYEGQKANYISQLAPILFCNYPDETLDIISKFVYENNIVKSLSSSLIYLSLTNFNKVEDILANINYSETSKELFILILRILPKERREPILQKLNRGLFFLDYHNRLIVLAISYKYSPLNQKEKIKKQIFEVAKTIQFEYSAETSRVFVEASIYLPVYMQKELFLVLQKSISAQYLSKDYIKFKLKPPEFIIKSIILKYIRKSPNFVFGYYDLFHLLSDVTLEKILRESMVKLIQREQRGDNSFSDYGYLSSLAGHFTNEDLFSLFKSILRYISKSHFNLTDEEEEDKYLDCEESLDLVVKEITKRTENNKLGKSEQTDIFDIIDEYLRGVFRWEAMKSLGVMIPLILSLSKQFNKSQYTLEIYNNCKEIFEWWR